MLIDIQDETIVKFFTTACSSSFSVLSMCKARECLSLMKVAKGQISHSFHQFDDGEAGEVNSDCGQGGGDRRVLHRRQLLLLLLLLEHVQRLGGAR